LTFLGVLKLIVVIYIYIYICVLCPGGCLFPFGERENSWRKLIKFEVVCFSFLFLNIFRYGVIAVFSFYIHVIVCRVFNISMLMRKKSERSSRGGPQAVPGGAKPDPNPLYGGEGLSL
jgi:hypothetical protein